MLSAGNDEGNATHNGDRRFEPETAGRSSRLSPSTGTESLTDKKFNGP